MSNWNWTPRAKRIGWTLFWLEMIALELMFMYVLAYGSPLT